jgi:hypothetical protein
MSKAALATIAILALAAPASAQVGNAAMPIELSMRRGSDHLTVHGVLAQNVACCTYVFQARAGQTLYWSETGAAARIGLIYPDGDGINPGLPNPTPLPQTGTYTFTVSPDLMAEGAFGPFTLKIRIPPAR